jgi:hypothetical protein
VQCPKCLISAESLSFLDLHRSWRAAGRGWSLTLDAKTAEAFEVLEREWMAEEQHEKEE